MTQKKPPTKASQRQQKYDRDHCVHVGIKFNIETDAAILTRLSMEPSMAGYIRQLIAEDITRNHPDLLNITRFEKPEGKTSVGRVQKKSSKEQKKD